MPSDQSKSDSHDISAEEMREIEEMFETMGISSQDERDEILRQALSYDRRDDGIKFVGQISREDYERHANSPGVQALIQSSRRSWMKRYGVDPAAARVASAQSAG